MSDRPDIILAGSFAMKVIRRYWHKEIAKRCGVTYAAIERFYALGWLPDSYGLGE